MTVYYAPHITTMAGACLTQANWRDLAIRYAFCTLSHLLVKPGLSFWQNGMDLKTYLAWDNNLILDLSDLQANEREEFRIQSPYDGSRLILNLDQLWDLLAQIKPDALVMSEKLTQKYPSTLSIPWLVSSNLSSATQKMQQVQGLSAKGRFFEDQELILYAADCPGEDALQGIVYQTQGCFKIQDLTHAKEFQTLEDNCACPTCQQGLTRAYLHYLIQSTPLLGQRLLMMHNVFWFRKFLASC